VFIDDTLVVSMSAQSIARHLRETDDLDTVSFRPCWRCGLQFPRENIVCPQCGSNQKNLITKIVSDNHYSQIRARKHRVT